LEVPFLELFENPFPKNKGGRRKKGWGAVSPNTTGINNRLGTL
jgi:hypothetical protein